MRLMPNTKHTPMHIHFLDTRSMLTATENKLQTLFKIHSNIDSPFSEMSPFLISLPSSVLMPPSHLLLRVTPPPASKERFTIHMDHPSSALTIAPCHFICADLALHTGSATHNHSSPQDLSTQNRLDSETGTLSLLQTLCISISPLLTPAEPVLGLFRPAALHVPILPMGFTLSSAWKSCSVVPLCGLAGSLCATDLPSTTE